ncbi:MAG: hypothetical protein Q7R97_05205 [Candidatus Daviesbacteria bacterium]|nr:hypothetical protein [Candidatus Daviesbacteria bacterium]
MKMNAKTLSQFEFYLTIIALLFAFPIGLVLMWYWMSWPKILKLLITIIPIAFILVIFFFGFYLGKA